MKALTCEMCGSTNLLKQDGVFVCQSCGTKYSVEEAKRMMVEGTVDVKGTVKVDITDELKNLYEIARRAKDTDNSENAMKYYDMIMVKDPSSWEANFYVVYFKAMSCRIAEISSAGDSVASCVEAVIGLVKQNVTDEAEQKEVLTEITSRCLSIAGMLAGGAKSHYEGIDSEIQHNYTQEFVNNEFSAMQILYVLGNVLDTEFGAKYGDLAASSWKGGIEIHKDVVRYLTDKTSNQNMINDYATKIKKYDASYVTPEISTGGCYVATAVYGSYECPEVWTLRRFRDNTLAETWYGRAFIHTYYAISPTLVKWFGHTEWFKKMWKEPLDSLVRKLQSEGVENTPYNDRIW